VFAMADARKKTRAKKRRRGIPPYCRKVTLTPREITEVCQGLDAGLPELNSKFSHPPPAPELPPGKRGAPPGNKNRLVHGKFTGEMFAFRAEIRTYLRASRRLVEGARRILQVQPQPD
jgi:hypothetical protein